MATIQEEFEVPASADAVWAVLRDFGGLLRLAPGFITGCTLEEEGAVRLVTFANGMQVRERLVTLDEGARRIVYTAFGGRTTHYNGAAQVLPLPKDLGCRLVWTIDLLPDEMAQPIGQLARAGAQAMRSALTPASPS